MRNLFIMIFLLTSCYDGEINGRKYKLKWNCVKSHVAHGLRPVSTGKVMTVIPYTRTVCDSGYYDTIFQLQSNKEAKR